jgi:hypothetical protein
MLFSYTATTTIDLLFQIRQGFKTSLKKIKNLFNYEILLQKKIIYWTNTLKKRNNQMGLFFLIRKLG